MRIYANCKEAVNELRRNLYELSIEVFPNSMQNKVVKNDDNFKTKELQNESFTILNTEDKDKIVKPEHLPWLHTEFGERISRQDNNPGQAWLMRKSTWEPLLNKEGQMDYTYAGRMKDQIDYIIKELKTNPDSRQCVIDIHDSEDVKYMSGVRRIPCSLNYIFQIRKDGNNVPKLNVTYNMRSCDYYLHFKNDIWLAAELRDYIAKEVNVKPGSLTMNIASLHAYKRDWELNVY
jgi:thymidylate synthase